ncbi:MAG: hypothetical protein ACRELX_10395, partial [Longimicrobiales bacterium]
FHGQLDWFNLDVDPNGAELPPSGAPVREVHRAFFPTALTFEGMPHTRWWTFEDGNTSFGDISPDTNELGKLLFMEFGLVFANDWFLVPLTVPTGSLIQVRGLAVSNVFGERIWIEKAGSGPDASWQHWRMFQLSMRGASRRTPADNSLVMLPSVARTLEQRPAEEFALVRDEVANMVWAIEDMVPLPTGVAKRGREAALETRAYFERIVRAASGGGEGEELPCDLDTRSEPH